MLSSHIVASLVLAGLSMAHPQHYHTDPAPVQADTSDAAKLFPIVPTGTLTSINHHISSTAQLSKRHDPPSDGGDWDDVAKGGIGEIGDMLGDILDFFRGDEQETVSHTITITQDPGKPTPTEEPGSPSAPAKTTVTTVTSITAPGKTVTTTVVPTTVVPDPEPTESRAWPTPGKPGCSPDDKDCGEE